MGCSQSKPVSDLAISPFHPSLSVALLSARGLPDGPGVYYAVLTLPTHKQRSREVHGRHPVFNARVEANCAFGSAASVSLYRCASRPKRLLHRIQRTLSSAAPAAAAPGASPDALLGTLSLALPPTLLDAPPPPVWVPLPGAPGVELHVHVAARSCASACDGEDDFSSLLGRLTLHFDALEGFSPPPSLLAARRLRIVVTHGLKAFATSVALPDAALEVVGGGGAAASPAEHGSHSPLELIKGLSSTVMAAGGVALHERAAPAAAPGAPAPPLPLDRQCRTWVRRGEEAYVACVELFADAFGSPPEPLALAYVPLEHLTDGATRVFRAALAPAHTAEADAARRVGELGLTDAGLNKLIAHLGEEGVGFHAGAAGAAPPELALGAAGGELAPVVVEVEAAAPAEGGSGAPPPMGALLLRARFDTRSQLEGAFCAAVATEFDADGDGRLDEGELLAMFASLGGDVPCISAEGATAGLYAALNAPGGDGKLPLEDVARHAWAHLPLSFSLLNFFADGASSSRRLLAAFAGGGYEKNEGVMGRSAVVVGHSERTREGAARAVLRTGGRTVVDDAGLVCVQRATGLLVQEHVPARIKTALKLMYASNLGSLLTRTAGVRAALKALSVHEGRVMDAPASRADIAKFVREFAIPEDELLVPLGEYANFNAFFSRKLRPGARPVAAPGDPGVVVSPADCRLAAFESQAEACDLWVKGEAFSLDALLGPAHAELAAALEGGPILVCRLAPQDYHRFHAPLAGVVEALTEIDGSLYTVNPLAVRSARPDIFTGNKRVVAPFRTAAGGLLAFVAVGATAVGSINFTARVGDAVEKGGELGFFAFGGSSVLVVFPRGASVSVDADILSNSRAPLETIVKQGEAIARCRSPAA
jgi:phosphatidylserine decarboxylase precursor